MADVLSEWRAVAENVLRFLRERGVKESLVRAAHVELAVVEEAIALFNPPVRPSTPDTVDTLVIMLTSRDPEQPFILGRLFNYPGCCVNAYVARRTYWLDREHREQLRLLPKGYVVLTEGFVPCMMTCTKAIERRLIGVVKDRSVIDEVERFLKGRLRLHKDLYVVVPNF